MSKPAWTDILNELNRDISRDQPNDTLQWAADWFQSKLRLEVCPARQR
jgi:cAMP-dependent protein kinase regulator